MAEYEDPNEAMVMDHFHGDVMDALAPDNPTADFEKDSGTTSIALANLADFRALTGKVITEEVYVPLLKKKLIVRAPTAQDIMTVRNSSQTQKGNRTLPRPDRDQATHYVYLCTVTPDGGQFFPVGFLRELLAMPYGVIQPLAQVILRLGGFDEEENEKAQRDAFS